MKILWLIPFFAMACTPIHINITEYGAQGNGLLTNAQVGGCAVDIRGDLPENLVVEYKGEKCRVTNNGNIQ